MVRNCADVEVEGAEVRGSVLMSSGSAAGGADGGVLEDEIDRVRLMTTKLAGTN
jgi:hypothetical protein